VTGAVDRALRLWEHPIPPGEAAVAAFREAYADPLVINGVEWTVTALVERARTTQAVLADIGFEVVDRIDAGDRCAIAFRQWGRHVGTMPGGHPLPPSGERVEGLGMDMFRIVEDRIAVIWVLSDLLAQLAGPATIPPQRPGQGSDES
jgi:SnoaL-like polyketide cyclase